VSVSYKYDASADALYIRLSSYPVVSTVEIAEDTNVDLAASGALIGIEVLNPDRPWPLHRILNRFAISDEDAVMLMTAYPAPAVKVP
jgi:uncharacterized protein YuzE